MQQPQFQANRPQATQSQVMMAPQSQGKGNVFGSLAKLAFGAATGDPMSMISGGVGLLGGGDMGGSGGAAQSQSKSQTAGNQQSLNHEEDHQVGQEEPQPAALPTIGDLSNSQMQTPQTSNVMMAPPSPFQSQPGLQTDPANGIFLSPNLWVNRVARGGLA